MKTNRKLVVGVNDFATLHPEIAKEWHPKLNGDKKPSDFLPMSRFEAQWLCLKCGRVWSTSIAHRSKGSGCPDCKKLKASISLRAASIRKNGTLLEKYPELCEEWHPTKNIGKSPANYSPGSNEVIWWLCSKCGYDWPAPIYRRARRHSGCPQCASERSTSFPEQALCYYLSKVTDTVSRYVEDRKEIDIFLPLLNAGIEYDGMVYHEDGDGASKDAYFINKGIKIYHVKEIASGQISRIENETVLYSYKNSDYSNIEEAVKLVFKLLKLPIIEININDDRYKIRENYISLVKKNSIVSKCPDLAKEWDYEGNGKIKPDYISYSSNKLVKWICPKGHHYQTRVFLRYRGIGCSICANKTLSVGDNDLETLYPDLAKEWDIDGNNGLTPREVIAGGHISRAWRCSKCHLSWKTPIPNRIKGSGCPYCSNHSLAKGYNDIATRYPELAKEWDVELNNGLMPSDVIDGSEQLVWWRCPDCGKPYKAKVCNRIRGTGCQNCYGKKISKKAIERSVKRSGSLGEKYPYLLEEWDYTNNANIDPFSISPGSSLKVSWICKQCGNKWDARISHRTSGSKCRVCAQKEASLKHKKKVLLVETGQIFDGVIDAAHWLGVSDCKAISQCCNGKKEKYHGFHWKYVE